MSSGSSKPTSVQKRDRVVYIAGRNAISILKAVAFIIAALFASVFRPPPGTTPGRSSGK